VTWTISEVALVATVSLARKSHLSSTSSTPLKVVRQNKDNQGTAASSKVHEFFVSESSIAEGIEDQQGEWLVVVLASCKVEEIYEELIQRQRREALEQGEI